MDCNYAKGAEYWAKQAADVGGMLGGFDNLSVADVRDSGHFIRLLRKHGVGSGRALDCGSGIGRVTKLTLLPAFDTVDMVDVTESFISHSAEYLGPELEQRVGHKFVSGLQDFAPAERHYDVVWIQWVSGYLNDDDLVAFLKVCSRALRPDGAIVLKENLATVGTHDFDAADSSYARSRDCLLQIGDRAGLAPFLEKKQRNWPQGMLPVRMFAFRSKEPRQC